MAIRHTFGLLFLEAQEVSDCSSYHFMSDRPINELLTKYFEYLIIKLYN